MLWTRARLCKDHDSDWLHDVWGIILVWKEVTYLHHVQQLSMPSCSSTLFVSSTMFSSKLVETSSRDWYITKLMRCQIRIISEDTTVIPQIHMGHNGCNKKTLQVTAKVRDNVHGRYQTKLIERSPAVPGSRNNPEIVVRVFPVVLLSDPRGMLVGRSPKSLQTSMIAVYFGRFILDRAGVLD